MQDSEDVPDEVPVADAVEQQRPPTDSVPDEEEVADEATDDVPLETTPSDWQEQHQTVDPDPHLEGFDYDR